MREHGIDWMPFAQREFGSAHRRGRRPVSARLVACRRGTPGHELTVLIGEFGVPLGMGYDGS
ncbi:hypothetical protein [Streptomyces prunicolor]|uniref:hypothetical protein n=1 Tax=Streptomyces prunicolor TaxID=67348 RepID=UPI0003A85F3F|nr:hypothetical protein [Streptomyces prunicolor]